MTGFFLRRFWPAAKCIKKWLEKKSRVDFLFQAETIKNLEGMDDNNEEEKVADDVKFAALRRQMDDDPFFFIPGDKKLKMAGGRINVAEEICTLQNFFSKKLHILYALNLLMSLNDLKEKFCSGSFFFHLFYDAIIFHAASSVVES